jgi:hypothetical protein
MRQEIVEWSEECASDTSIGTNKLSQEKAR